jgi:hypothetical protein
VYVKVPEPVNRRMQPARNPYADPFARLIVVDEGPTLLVTMSGADPAARMQRWRLDDPAVAGANPEQVQIMEGMLKGARLAFKLESPFAVVDAVAPSPTPRLPAVSPGPAALSVLDRLV